MKKIFLIINMLFVSTYSFSIDPGVPLKEGWELTWQDEFNGDVVDPTKWTIINGGPVYNQELQYYTPEEVSVANGNLVIRSQKRSFMNKHYTSGRLHTKGRFYQQYGYFEVRAKLPKTQGIWPAHWMMPQSGQWPPEIDIMEFLGHDPFKVYFTYHWGTSEQHSQKGGNYVAPFDFSKEFHTFGLEWSENEMIWYVDDVKRFSIKQGNMKFLPAEPFYFILNTAVGGTWPGNPNATTVFPQYHFVDYLRAFKKVENAAVDDWQR